MGIARRLGVLVLFGFLAAPAGGEDKPRYRDEMEKRLGSADSELLDLQAARFRANFAATKDEEEVERLEKEFRELQKERRDLLRATGKMP